MTESAGAMDEQPGNAANARILVVEDEILIRMMLSEQLRETVMM
ncbi:hypothetical protein [Sphingorhabdus sp.]